MKGNNDVHVPKIIMAKVILTGSKLWYNENYFHDYPSRLCLDTVNKRYSGVPAQHKLTTARPKKGTAHSFRLANSARIFINLSWYDVTRHGS